MTPTETIQLIDRLRREMPRNGLVMDLCTTCEILLKAAPKPKAERPISSRAVYMREHRKKERALIRQARQAEQREKK
jgi:hypothetical protein